MPNHIYNVITFDCGHERAQQILEDLKCDGCDLGSIDFNKLIPMPDNVYKGPLGFKEREMYPGDLNWYDWSIENWGTKWNAYGFDELPHKEDAIVFNTAWSAVPKVVELMSERYPEVSMEYSWADEDFGSNTGQVEFKNGEVLSIYMPVDQSPEAYEFAAAIQDASIEDFGFTKDPKTGNIRFTDEVFTSPVRDDKPKAKESER
ncbi:MAG: hypothetical protein IKF42_05575 [Mogibacterium sp.]|nr:hypothetical protein [Mogibacterium sp.]